MTLDSLPPGTYHPKSITIIRKDIVLMHANSIGGVVLLAGCVMALASGAMAVEAPPAMNIPSSGVMGQQHLNQITDWLSYWSQEIADGDAKAITTAAREALRSYRSYSNSDFRYRFGEKAAEILWPVLANGLKRDDKLLRLKEVNLALVLARIPQVSIVPALESMVSHRGPAVRYLGWKGYREARPVILAQSSEVAKKMLTVLTAAAAKEKSAPAIGAICEMANISSFTSAAGPAIPPGTLRDAQTKAFGMIEANWLAWCRRVMNGEAEMTKACGKGIEAIKTLSAALAAGQDSKKKALQMLVELMYAAAKAYDEADGKGRTGTENTALLQGCELTAAAMSGLRKDYITAALRDDDIKARGAAVRSAAWNWITDLKALGVVEPKIAVPVAAATATPASTNP